MNGCQECDGSAFIVDPSSFLGIRPCRTCERRIREAQEQAVLDRFLTRG